MVGENFEIFMSEMPEIVANCQKSDSPPGRYLKIQIPHQSPSSPGTLKSDSPSKKNPLKMTLCWSSFDSTAGSMCTLFRGVVRRHEVTKRGFRKCLTNYTREPYRMHFSPYVPHIWLISATVYFDHQSNIKVCIHTCNFAVMFTSF